MRASEQHSCASHQAQEAAVTLLKLMRQLRLGDPFPNTDDAVADVTAVSEAPAPRPSEEIRRRQLAMLERHVTATRTYRGTWRNS